MKRRLLWVFRRPPFPEPKTRCRNAEELGNKKETETPAKEKWSLNGCVPSRRQASPTGRTSTWSCDSLWDYRTFCTEKRALVARRKCWSRLAARKTKQHQTCYGTMTGVSRAILRGKTTRRCLCTRVKPVCFPELFSRINFTRLRKLYAQV